jgi:hypothetical protein
LLFLPRFLPSFDLHVDTAMHCRNRNITRCLSGRTCSNTHTVVTVPPLPSVDRRSQWCYRYFKPKTLRSHAALSHRALTGINASKTFRRTWRMSVMGMSSGRTISNPRAYYAANMPVPSGTTTAGAISTIEISIRLQECISL